MSRTSYENFGKNAEELDNYLEIAARNMLMKDCEKQIIFDVLDKLNLEVSDTVLDIGCGSGNLLIPLSFIVNEITGIDHPSCIFKLKERVRDLTNISLIGNNFLDEKINSSFSKIICYSVLQYLKDINEVLFFIKKALFLLSPGGKALFADLPNISKKKRFLNSSFGKNFDKDWASKLSEITKNQKPNSHWKKDEKLVRLDDESIIQILSEIRKIGYHSYILDQSSNLCSGYTREDLLIVKPFE